MVKPIWYTYLRLKIINGLYYIYMSPKTIIFIGPPGSGKGTQQRLLEEVLKNKSENPVVVLSPGDGFRAFFKTNPTYSKDLIEISVNKGNLQPDFIVDYMVTKILIDNIEKHSHLIVDGYPRTEGQRFTLESMFDFYGMGKVDVISFSVPKDIVTERMLLRGRQDDTKETILTRFEEYHERTEKLVNKFKENSRYTIHNIDASRTIEKIHEDVLTVLNINDKT